VCFNKIIIILIIIFYSGGQSGFLTLEKIQETLEDLEDVYEDYNDDKDEGHLELGDILGGKSDMLDELNIDMSSKFNMMRLNQKNVNDVVAC